MRVLIVLDCAIDRNSGLARSARNLLAGLRLNGIDTALVGPVAKRRVAQTADNISLDMFGANGRHWSWASSEALVAPWEARRVVRRAVACSSPDLIHVLTPFTLGARALAVSASSGIPSVLSFHIAAANARAHSRATAAGRWVTIAVLRAAYRRAAQWATRISAPTASAAAMAREVMPGREVVVVSNGVTALQRKGEVRCPDRSGTPRLLYVGRLSPEKRVRVLVQAFKILHDRLPEATLRIIGDGRERPRLERLVDRQGIGGVSFAGSVSDGELATEYEAAWLLCAPCPDELEGLSSLEALSVGIPVIAADSPATRELASTTNACILAPPDDPVGLAAALLRGLDQLEELFTAASSSHAGTVRSLTEIGAQWRSVYERLLEQKMSLSLQ
jgi:glycosyltransferase involved in cell wall biosynthesis